MNRASLLLAPLGVGLPAVLLAGGRRMDAAALEGFRSLPSEWSAASDSFIRSVDSAASSIAVGVVAFGITIVVLVSTVPRFRSHERDVAHLKMVWALGAAVLVSFLAKHLIPRPVVDDAVLTGNTLPSGHTVGVVAALALAGFVFTPYSRKGYLLPALPAVVVGWSALVLITTGHRTSDVLVAIMIVEVAVAAVSVGEITHITWYVAGGYATSAMVISLPFVPSFLHVTLLSALSLILVAVASVGLSVTVVRSAGSDPGELDRIDARNLASA